MGRRAGALVCALVVLSAGAAAGCGGGEVAKDAVLQVYVSAPLSGVQAAAGRRMCGEARDELARHDDRAGELRLRVTCLDDTGGARRWRLAAIGADARRAVEDSSTIAYVGELEAAPTRFSQTIVEPAEIGQVPGPSGRRAMREVLGAVEAAGGGGELRKSVSQELSGG